MNPDFVMTVGIYYSKEKNISINKLIDDCMQEKIKNSVACCLNFFGGNEDKIFHLI